LKKTKPTKKTEYKKTKFDVFYQIAMISLFSLLVIFIGFNVFNNGVILNLPKNPLDIWNKNEGLWSFLLSIISIFIMVITAISLYKSNKNASDTLQFQKDEAEKRRKEYETQYFPVIDFITKEIKLTKISKKKDDFTTQMFFFGDKALFLENCSDSYISNIIIEAQINSNTPVKTVYPFLGKGRTLPIFIPSIKILSMGNFLTLRIKLKDQFNRNYIGEALFSVSGFLKNDKEYRSRISMSNFNFYQVDNIARKIEFKTENEKETT